MSPWFLGSCRAEQPCSGGDCPALESGSPGFSLSCDEQHGMQCPVSTLSVMKMKSLSSSKGQGVRMKSGKRLANASASVGHLRNHFQGAGKRRSGESAGLAGVSSIPG